MERNQTLRFSSHKNRKSKVKLWWVGARERKKSAFFATIIFVWRIFFSNICVLSQCVVCWINFENIYFYILKNITSYDFLFAFNIAESLQCIFKKVMGEEAINQKTQTPKSWYIDLAYTWWKKRECCM